MILTDWPLSLQNMLRAGNGMLMGRRLAQSCLCSICWLKVKQQLPACLQETESVPGAEGAKRTATQPDRNAKRMKPLASFSEGLTEEDEVGPNSLLWQSSQ